MQLTFKTAYYSTQINVKNVDLNVIENALRKKINKLPLKNRIDIHNEFNCIVPICNVCSEEFVPYRYLINVSEDKTIQITNVKTDLKKFQYCYQKSIKCKNWKANPNSIKFLTAVMRISEEEARQWIHVHNKSTFYRENYASEGEYLKSQSRNIAWFKSKYGDKEGEIRYKTTIEKQNYKKSLDGFIDRYGEEEGKKKYKKYSKEKDSMTMSWINRIYPTLTNEEKNHLLSKRRKSVGLTKKEFIEKHGIEAFEKLIKHRISSRTTVQTSMWANNLILRLIDIFELNHTPLEKLLCGDYSEFRLYDEINKCHYFYDLYVKLTNGKEKIVEFNGHKFHAPPNLTEEEKMMWKHPYSDTTWDESKRKDQQKKNFAMQKGIDVLEVWDHLDDNDSLINKIMEFLNE